MTVLELRSEIDQKLRPRLIALEDERTRHVRIRDTALAVEPRSYNEDDVESARCEIATIDSEIAKVTERIGALERQLPVVERNDALTEAKGLLPEVEKAHAEYRVALSRFSEQVNRAELAARSVVLTKADGRAVTAKLQALVSRYALDIAVPAMPSLDRDSTNIAGVISIMIRDVASHQVIESIVERELMAARARLTQL